MSDSKNVWDESFIPVKSLTVQKLLALGVERIARRMNHRRQWEYAGWIVCSCGKGRWKQSKDLFLRKSDLCWGCSVHKNLVSEESLKNRAHGVNHHMHKENSPGCINSYGYRVINIPLAHPFRSMSFRGKISEHRLVMAEHLGRALESWEVVHHKNQNKSDNRIENLELLSTTDHVLVTRMEREINRLKADNARLRIENERLNCASQNNQDQKRMLPSFYPQIDEVQMHVCG